MFRCLLGSGRGVRHRSGSIAPGPKSRVLRVTGCSPQTGAKPTDQGYREVKRSLSTKGQRVPVGLGRPVSMPKVGTLAGLSAEESHPGKRVPPLQPDAVYLQLRQDPGVLPVPRLPAGCGSTPGQPCLQFRHRPGQVHGTLRAQRPPGSCLVLVRRMLGASERIPCRRLCPFGNGVQVAFTVPVRKRVKHVWTHWGVISEQLRPALAT